MTPLLLLAEKVEGLEGPDREVDALLDRMLFDRPKNGDYCPVESAIWRIREDGSGLLVRHDGYARDSFCPARYTASVDSALTLVPEGRDWMVDNFDGPADRRCCASVFNAAGEEYADYEAHGATPSLALCASALRARAAMEAGDAGDD